MLPATYNRPSTSVVVPADSYITNLGNTANLKIYTFAGVSFGTAHSSRIIVVATGVRFDFSTTISCTIAGVAASLIVQEGPTSGNPSAMFYISVPTGLTGDIVITTLNTVTQCAIGVWAIYGKTTNAPTAFNSARNSDPLSFNANTVATSTAIAFTAHVATVLTTTGVPDDFLNVLPGGTQYTTGGMQIDILTETPRTFSYDYSAATNGMRGIVAIWTDA